MFFDVKETNLEKPVIPIQSTETPKPTVGGGSSRRTYLGCVDEDGILTASFNGECLRDIIYNISTNIHMYIEREVFSNIYWQFSLLQYF